MSLQKNCCCPSAQAAQVGSPNRRINFHVMFGQACLLVEGTPYGFISSIAAMQAPCCPSSKNHRACDWKLLLGKAPTRTMLTMKISHRNIYDILEDCLLSCLFSMYTYYILSASTRLITTAMRFCICHQVVFSFLKQIILQE